MNEPVENSRSLVKKNLWWVVLEAGTTSIFGLLVYIFLARIVGPHAIGIASIAIGFTQLVQVALETMFHDAIVQRKSLADSHISSAVFFSYGVGLGFAAFYYFAANQISIVFGQPLIAELLPVLGLSLIVCGANGVMTAKLRRDMNFKLIAARSVFSKLFGAAIALLMGILGAGVWALVAQQVVVVVFTSVALYSIPSCRPSFTFKFDSLRDLARFSFFSLVSSIVLQANLKIFTLLVGFFMGPAATGYFSVAVRFVETARSLLTTAFTQLALPLFSRKQESNAALVRGFIEATRFSCFVSFPLFLGLLALSPGVVSLFLGDGWDLVIPIVRVLCLGAAIHMARLATTPLLSAMGRPDLLASQNVLGLISSLVLVFFFKDAGVVWATLAWSIRPYVLLPLNLIFILRTVSISVIDQIRPVLPSLCISLITALVLGFAQHSGVGYSLASFSLLILIGAALYLGAAYFFMKPVFIDLLSFLLRRKRA